MSTGRVEIHHVHASVAGRVLVRRPAARSLRGVLLGFHGYAETAETQLARLAAVAGADDWLLVSAQALNRFYRGRSQETVAGWMTRQDRDLAIAANVGYVDRILGDIVRKICAEGDSPLKVPVPLVYVGFSQGVAMAFRAATLGTAVAAGIVACGGDVPPELLGDPGTKFPSALLIRGARDEWYTAAKLAADAGALRARGVVVATVTIDAGHEWTDEVAVACGPFIAAIADGLRSIPDL